MAASSLYGGCGMEKMSMPALRSAAFATAAATSSDCSLMRLSA